MLAPLMLLAFPLVETFAEGPAAGDGQGPAQYQLGTQDKVRIKVFEWRPSRDEIYEWTALNAEYTVNASGCLSLPLLGDLAVAGRSTSAVAREIGDRLKQRMGLVESPDTTVEVIQFRPFYIVGAVEKAGEYPYRPGLTVLGAYAIAGGRQRDASGLSRLGREGIITRGDLRVFGLETQSLMARMARLEAELAEASEIRWPAALKDQSTNGAIERILKQEQGIFDSRRQAFRAQREALQQLQSYLEQGVGSMERQLEVHETEVASVKAEHEMVDTLYKKGLSSAPRKLMLERNVAQVNGERLRLESSLMLARQEVSKTKIALIDLEAKHSGEVSNEIRQTQARLEELRSRTDTSQHLLYEAEVLAPKSLADEELAQKSEPVFKILRGVGALASEQVVSSTALVEPGDTITVEQPTFGYAIGGPLRSSARVTPNGSY